MSSEEVTATFLGIVQGLTEFLPVSSSGHLVVFQHWLPAMQGDKLSFDLLLHIGTLIPVVWVYRNDILVIFKDMAPQNTPFIERSGIRMMGLIVVGSVPTAVIGLLFKETFTSLFDQPGLVGIAFAVTGTALFATKYISKSNRSLNEFTWKDAILIGLIQGMAITPGISRSGSTIAAALFLGLKRDLAAKYSFLLSIPVIGGAFLLEVREMDTSLLVSTPFVLGFFASIISGYFALIILLRLVKGGDFSKFCWYLWPLAVVTIVYGFWL